MKAGLSLSAVMTIIAAAMALELHTINTSNPYKGMRVGPYLEALDLQRRNCTPHIMGFDSQNCRLATNEFLYQVTGVPAQIGVVRRTETASSHLKSQNNAEMAENPITQAVADVIGHADRTAARVDTEVAAYEAQGGAPLPAAGEG